MVKSWWLFYIAMFFNVTRFMIMLYCCRCICFIHSSLILKTVNPHYIPFQFRTAYFFIQVSVLQRDLFWAFLLRTEKQTRYRFIVSIIWKKFVAWTDLPNTKNVSFYVFSLYFDLLDPNKHNVHKESNLF